MAKCFECQQEALPNSNYCGRHSPFEQGRGRYSDRSQWQDQDSDKQHDGEGGGNHEDD